MWLAGGYSRRGSTNPNADAPLRAAATRLRDSPTTTGCREVDLLAIGEYRRVDQHSNRRRHLSIPKLLVSEVETWISVYSNWTRKDTLDFLNIDGASCILPTHNYQSQNANRTTDIKVHTRTTTIASL